MLNTGPAIVAAVAVAALLTVAPRLSRLRRRYDAAALCRVLRTGLDPATVQLPRAMPR